MAAINSCNCNEEETRALIAALTERVSALEEQLASTPPKIVLEGTTLNITTQ